MSSTFMAAKSGLIAYTLMKKCSTKAGKWKLFINGDLIGFLNKKIHFKRTVN